MEDESSNESSANSSDEQENSEDQQSTDESSNTKKYATNIYETLLDIYSPGSYCCGGVIEDVCLPGLQIEGVGAIGLPLVESQAKDIAKVCSPAPYGKKEKTIYDTSVRNTEQLDPSKITFKNPRWRECLQKMVSQIADDLGIITPIGCNLYKLLLYKEGSFFKPHRDTEKEDKMFGTLVVQLPSEYQGGELIVKHEKREKVFDYSSECFSISFAAFYADCQHEVKPVTKGYRLCLVYNLIHQGSGALPTPVDISMPVNAIVASLNKWRNDPTGPETLAFKLGHKYSEAALFVDDLKGTDRYECAVMRQACNIASFRLYLAILKVTYTNNNYNPYYDNEDDVETTYSLENFTNMNGKRVNHDQELNSDQIVPEDFMDGLTPDGSDFEEATGNAGATKERWYHTAVMVVWPGQERTKTEPDSKKRKTSK